VNIYLLNHPDDYRYRNNSHVNTKLY